MTAFLQKTLGEKYYKLFCQLFKFGIVGVLNTCVDTAVFFLFFSVVFTKNLDYQPVAFVAGYTCGLICSYILNKLWTFKEKSKSLRQIVLFILVNLVAMGVGLGELELLKMWSIVGLLAKILSVPLTLLVNFTGNKLLVFKNS